MHPSDDSGVLGIAKIYALLGADVAFEVVHQLLKLVIRVRYPREFHGSNQQREDDRQKHRGFDQRRAFRGAAILGCKPASGPAFSLRASSKKAGEDAGLQPRMAAPPGLHWRSTTLPGPDVVVHPSSRPSFARA